jgi:hypothetical protein
MKTRPVREKLADFTTVERWAEECEAWAVLSFFRKWSCVTASRGSCSADGLCEVEKLNIFPDFSGVCGLCGVLS